MSQRPHYAAQEFAGVQGRDNRKKLDRRYSRIADNYRSLEEVRGMSAFSISDIVYWQGPSSCYQNWMGAWEELIILPPDYNFMFAFNSAV